MLKNKRRVGGSFGLLAVLALFAALLPGGAAQADEGGAKFVTQSQVVGGVGLGAESASAAALPADCHAWIGSETGVGAYCEWTTKRYRAIAYCEENSGSVNTVYGNWQRNGAISTAWCYDYSWAVDAGVQIN